MSIDAALQAAIASIPQCLAAGYIDLTTGELLGIRTVNAYPREFLDFLAVASADMFQGPNVLGIEKTFKKTRGALDARHYFQEIFVMSDNLLHVFMRSKSNQDHISCFVCRKSVSLGLAMTESRAAMLSIEAAI